MKFLVLFTLLLAAGCSKDSPTSPKNTPDPIPTMTVTDSIWSKLVKFETGIFKAWSYSFRLPIGADTLMENNSLYFDSVAMGVVIKHMSSAYDIKTYHNYPPAFFVYCLERKPNKWHADTVSYTRYDTDMDYFIISGLPTSSGKMIFHSIMADSITLSEESTAYLENVKFISVTR